MALNRLFQRLRVLEALHNVAPDLVHPKMAEALEKQKRKDIKHQEVGPKLKEPINTFFTTDIGYLKQYCTDSFQLYKDHGKLVMFLTTKKDFSILNTFPLNFTNFDNKKFHQVSLKFLS